ncbi:MAG: hypothetical protein BGO45_15695 [Microbacterium sp. 71-36]|uniref:hypothetical protein n=1 Tax=unclassified Microbacterium TaxID=2609290 RepID=UPI000869089D|nr:MULTISPECIES: hypothetical protein [unclassified Microbacterium]MBN9212387.1 hypothetical protein [Microbacterium sp.]ODT38674.1 MAG: hypothetical protein ABS60_09580 [Microbacterium sp. SCN 71-17]OJV78115.1 MAG: hypothetical protein BGO45_15695 [Microbacterium sp. 71-36]
MTHSDTPALPDLTGSVDERLARLDDLERDGALLPAAWLQRQLRTALAEWADDETRLDIVRENHDDY